MIIISDELESRFGEGNVARQSSISYEGKQWQRKKCLKFHALTAFVLNYFTSITKRQFGALWSKNKLPPDEKLSFRWDRTGYRMTGYPSYFRIDRPNHRNSSSHLPTRTTTDRCQTSSLHWISPDCYKRHLLYTDGNTIIHKLTYFDNTRTPVTLDRLLKIREVKWIAYSIVCFWREKLFRLAKSLYEIVYY